MRKGGGEKSNIRTDGRMQSGWTVCWTGSPMSSIFDEQAFNLINSKLVCICTTDLVEFGWVDK